MTVDTGALARRFPLVARSRPPCAPLDARVGELCRLADSAARSTDPTAASAVYNQAALLASDAGLPDLARTWCHRHATLYLRSAPLEARTARHALEPLVNLARLHIRDGNGDTALQLLNDLFTAVSSRTDTVVDGLEVPCSTLTSTEDDHQQLRTWLWTVLLADGSRALTTAGRWREALAHLHRHRGVGARMLDGRQVAVIASALSGETDRTLALLRDTAPGEPWENAVTATLTVLFSGRRAADRNVHTMLDLYQALECPDRTAVFHTRLGLTVVDALGGTDHPQGRRIATDLIRRAVEERDGYRAREILTHPSGAAQPARDALAEVTASCGLGTGRLPEALHGSLTEAVETSEATLTRMLHTRTGQACGGPRSGR